jgi:transposase
MPPTEPLGSHEEQKPMASYRPETEGRRRALRGLLIRLGYGRLNVEAVVEWTEGRDDTSVLSPHVRQCDRRAVATLLSWYETPPAATWGPETDADRWQLGPEPSAMAAEGGVLCSSK